MFLWTLFKQVFGTVFQARMLLKALCVFEVVLHVFVPAVAEGTEDVCQGQLVFFTVFLEVKDSVV